ncbi:hypothetical protein GOP47_0007211 [Adiantum capillus-veneris]|uniref:Uncharacterized protein n=1 Tax=Adiantum capillus-veneris TaxID=13818 RepID=A0A9D4V138_ADICA|nr:hypothetical protein GOP47_0007211 [Adiantum capillus-veneris]
MRKLRNVVNDDDVQQACDEAGISTKAYQAIFQLLKDALKEHGIVENLFPVPHKVKLAKKATNEDVFSRIGTYLHIEDTMPTSLYASCATKTREKEVENAWRHFLVAEEWNAFCSRGGYCWLIEGMEEDARLEAARAAAFQRSDLGCKAGLAQQDWKRQEKEMKRRRRELHSVPKGPNPISNDLPTSGFYKTFRSPPSPHHPPRRPGPARHH